MGDLSKYFDRKEFACKCGCGFDDVHPRLIERLEAVRELYCEPLLITSGCRCAKHNEASGGKEDSAHLRGLAADIQVSNSRERYELLIFLLNRFYRIGIAKTFIHVDVDTLKDKDVCWMY